MDILFSTVLFEARLDDLLINSHEANTAVARRNLKDNSDEDNI